jgi:hypothetical protein
VRYISFSDFRYRTEVSTALRSGGPLPTQPVAPRACRK